MVLYITRLIEGVHRKNLAVAKWAMVLAMVFFNSSLFAQCTPVMRVYAPTEHINANFLSSVTSETNAADNDITTFSTLNAVVSALGLGTVTQYLEFSNSTPIPAGTPVTIKLSLPAGLLSLLGGVTIQPFTNLHNNLSTLGTWQADAAGPATTNSSLLGLLSGVGDDEITITPSVDYNGVWIQISGVAIGQSMSVYGAYITQPATATAACNTPIDVLSGVKAVTVLGNIGGVLGTVQNPQNAIDIGTNSSNTFAEIDAVASILSEVYHTTIFNSPSQPGDIVKMIVQNSGPGLLDLGVGSGFSVQLYNGTTPVGDPIAGASNNIKLVLFPDGSDKYELDISPPASYGVYDRVQVMVGGVVALGLTQGLKIYDVKRVIATPVIDGIATDAKAVCSGNTATFTVTNAQACTTYSWYDAPTGGNLLQSDPVNASYTPPVASYLTPGTYNFYVAATRNGCSETTDRTKVTLTVNALPTITTALAPQVCAGIGGAVSMAYTATNAPTTYSIVWAAPAIAAHFNNITDSLLPVTGGINIAVPQGAPANTYNGTLTVKNANGCLSNPGQPISVTINPAASPPIVNIAF